MIQFRVKSYSAFYNAVPSHFSIEIIKITLTVIYFSIVIDFSVPTKSVPKFRYIKFEFTQLYPIQVYIFDPFFVVFG